MQTSGTPNTHPAIVAWIIWFSIFSGLIIMQTFIGGGFPTGTNDGEPSTLERYLPIGPAILAMVVRMLILPKISDPAKKLPAMVVGLALSESTGILGMFLVDPSLGGTRLSHLLLSLISILAFAPFYMSPKSSTDTYQR